MGRNLMRGNSYVISKERAESIRPVLKWIKEGASRKREREQAARILRAIEGIEDWKQIVLSRGEAEMLGFIIKEFPSGVEPTRQLSLFDLEKPRTTVLREAPKSFGHTPSGEEVELPPPSRVARELPVLKTKLTPEEESERKSTVSKPRYEPKPDSYYTERLKEES